MTEDPAWRCERCGSSERHPTDVRRCPACRRKDARRLLDEIGEKRRGAFDRLRDYDAGK